MTRGTSGRFARPNYHYFETSNAPPVNRSATSIGQKSLTMNPCLSRCSPAITEPAWVTTGAADTAVGYLIADLVDGNLHVEQVSIHPSTPAETPDER
jgi:hypothetical protein